MPRNLQGFPALNKVTNDVTQNLGVDPNKYLQDFPDIVPDIFSGITFFIDEIDKLMGWTVPTTSTDGIPDILNLGQSLLEGFDLTGPNSFVTQIVSAITGDVDTGLNELGDFFSGLWTSGETLLDQIGNAASADWNALMADLGLSGGVTGGGDSFSSFLTDLSTWWTDLFSGTSTDSGSTLADFINTLLGPFSPLDSGNLFGSIAPGLLSSVPVGSIGIGAPNYLINPGFATAESVVDQGMQGWSWNGTDGHSDNGCAQIVADGTWKTLESNAVPVQLGETMPMGIWTKYLSASSTNPSSNDIQLNARAYVTNAGGNLQLVSTTLIQAITSPAGDSSNSGQNDYLHLSGSFTVPSGVDHVAIQLAVAPNVTGGTLRFDDGLLSVSGLLAQDLVQDLTSDFDNIIGSFSPGGSSADFATGVTDFLELFGLTPTEISSIDINGVWTFIMNDIVNPLNVIVTTVDNVIVGISNTLTDVFDGIFGIGNSPVSSPIQAASVSNVLGGSNLGADVTAVHTSATDQNNWWTQLLSELGLSGGSGTGTNIGTALSTTASTASGAASNVNSTWSWLFGTMSPTSSSPVLPNKVGNVLGGSDFGNDIENLATALFGAPIVNTITTVEQDISNFISNAFSGGNAPTSTDSPVASIQSALVNIPASNVMFPLNPGTGTITHGAHSAATPFNGSPFFFEQLSWSHGVTITDNYLTVRLGFYGGANAVSGVQFGGRGSMHLLEQGYVSDVFTQIWGIACQAGTSSTETVTVSMTAQYSYIIVAAAEADSYGGVAGVGSTGSNTGSNGSPTLTLAGASGEYMINSLMVASTTATEALSSYSQTSQYSVSNLNGTGADMSFIAGDAAGASSVTFSATASNTAQNAWAAAAVALIPISTGQIGSGAFIPSTSATVSGSSGNNKFTTLFNGSGGATNGVAGVTITDDLTFGIVASVGGVLTVSQAGWYTVSMNVLEASTGTPHFVRPLLYHNGGVYASGPVVPVTATASNTWTFGHSWNIYCVPGDTLQGGYWLNTAVTSIFIGESTGTETYFSVALANRSLA